MKKIRLFEATIWLFLVLLSALGTNSFLSAMKKQPTQKKPIEQNKPFQIIDTKAITDTIKNNIVPFELPKNNTAIEKYFTIDKDNKQISLNFSDWIWDHTKPITEIKLNELIKNLDQEKIKRQFASLNQKIDPILLIKEFAQLVMTNYPSKDDADFFYCNCGSAVEGQRICYALELLNEFTKKYTTPSQKLVHVEFAARGNMQDLMHLYGLIKLGYRNLTYIIINPEIIREKENEPSSVEKNVEKLKKILNLSNYPGIEIKLFEYGQNYSNDVSQKKAPKAHSYSMVDPENDYGSYCTHEEYQSGVRKKYNNEGHEDGTERIDKTLINLIQINPIKTKYVDNDYNENDDNNISKKFQNFESIEILISKLSKYPHGKFYVKSLRENSHFAALENIITKEFTAAFKDPKVSYLDQKLKFFTNLKKAISNELGVNVDVVLFQGVIEDAFYNVVQTTKAVESPIIMSLKKQLIVFNKQFSFGPTVIYDDEILPEIKYYDETIEPLIESKKDELDELGWTDISEYSDETMPLIVLEKLLATLKQKLVILLQQIQALH